MRICKYCKKPIVGNDVWNPDLEGNGYHHACLSEMEFRSRDKQIYDKGRADVLDKIRAEIQENINYNKKMNYQGIVAGLLLALNIIDMCKEESEDAE